MEQELTQKEELLMQIKFMKDSSLDEFIIILKDSLYNYLKSLIVFGIDNNYSNQCLNIIKQMFLILLRERKILTSIEQSIDSVDLDETCDIIDMLDSLNDKTYTNFDYILGEIEYCCDSKEERKLPMISKDNLCDNPNYQDKVEILTHKKKKRTSLK